MNLENFLAKYKLHFKMGMGPRSIGFAWVTMVNASEEARRDIFSLTDYRVSSTGGDYFLIEKF